MSRNFFLKKKLQEIVQIHLMLIPNPLILNILAFITSKLF